jgi:hypothetical protein
VRWEEKALTNSTQAWCAALVFGLVGAGCGGDSRSPTAPSTPQLGPAGSNGSDTYRVADVILTGMVYEVTSTGRVPIEGVRVQSDYFHVFPTRDAVTDSRGLFSFRPIWVCPCSWTPWVVAGTTAIWVDKDGYEAPAGQQDSVFRHPLYPDGVRDTRLRDVNINGDTRFDVELVRR